MKPRLLPFAIVLIGLVALASLAPIQANITFGRWRDINPTQYTGDPTGTLRSTFVRNGGWGSIGAGDGWAVGGDTVLGAFVPVIAHYDGFSWPILSSPISAAIYYGVNFCTSPGAPGVGLCSPNGDGSDGWLVGRCQTAACNGVGDTAIAAYWDVASLTSKTTGLTNAANLTSVFMVCHSPQFGSGCPSSAGFVAGLTYAAGVNTTSSGASHASIWAFSGDPKSSGGWVEQSVLGTAADRFNSIYMFQDGSGILEGFAVGGNTNGGNGVVARLFGGGNTWTSTPIGGAANELLGVFVDQTNPIDAWAVGRGGQLWHFQSGFWSGPVSPAGTSQDLYSVQLVSSNEGWIVGADGVILHSTTLQSSVTWILLTQPIENAVGMGVNLLSTSFTGGGNGWAVGSNGVILQTQNSGCGSVVQTSSPQACWGGSTNVLNSLQLNAVWELGSSDAWAGGLFDPSSQCCSLIHWDGVKWHSATVSPCQTTHPDIWTIYMIGGGEGWAMGGSPATNKPEALLFNGQSWTGQPIASCPPGQCEPRSVYMIGGGTGGDGWAVGLNGVIWRHQSGSWLVFSQPTTNNLNGVFINNNGATGSTPAGFAVGNSGTVCKLTVTSSIPTWTCGSIPPVPSSVNLLGIYFKDSQHGWIVGSGSTIAQTIDGGNTWTGGQNQVTGCCGSVSTVANLTSVFIDSYGTGSGNGDGWAVGDDTTTNAPCPTVGSCGNAVFAHWDGVSWTYTPLVPPLLAGSANPGMSLRSVYLQNSQDGWTVGASVKGETLSGIIHLDPESPPIYGQQASSNTTSTSTSVSSTSSSLTSSSLSSIASTLSSTTSSSSTSTSSSSTTSISVSTSVSTFTVVSTPTTTTSSETSSVSTPLVMPAIPGFPWESILAGLLIGMAALAILRRKRT